jgi:tripartite-type tricarboxylate transporter receptor subunit TctC
MSILIIEIRHLERSEAGRIIQTVFLLHPGSLMHKFILSRRRVLALAAAGTVGGVSPVLVSAQDYPAKPIRLVHGFGAGASIDVVARLVGQRLSEAVGQSVIVEARPGATGTIANQAVIASPPDGYTLLIAPLAAVVTASHLYPVKYNALKDLVPISQVAYFDTVLVVGPSVKARNVVELVELAKSRSQPLTYSSPGAGTGFHIAGEMLAQMAGVKLLHVPYKGGGTAAFTDLIAGRVDMTFESLGTVAPQLQAGQLRAIAVTGAARSPALPDIPALAETLTGYQLSGWHGIFAPAGTPPGIVNQLNSALAKILSSTEMQQRWATMNLRFAPMSPDAFSKQIAADDAKYSNIIRERNIRVE